ncbi:MAG: alanine racemase [Acidimicrobiales bacterium]
MLPDDRPDAWAEIDTGAVESNARLLVDAVAPAALCAVVKAGGYGHGAVPAAEAALRGGASWLGVALVAEAAELRAQVAAPILLLAEPPHAQMPDVVELGGVRATVYSPEAIVAAITAVQSSGRTDRLPVHLKVDTGMHRVGAAPDAVPQLAQLIAESDALELEGFWTHLAVADEPDDGGYTARQLARFEECLATLHELGIHPPIVHAANSAGALAHPDARYDLVRCGIALYGIAPAPGLAGSDVLAPAMAVKSRVTFVKRLDAGERISYGLHHRFDRATTVATVAIGYNDGVPRSLGLNGGEVLIGGRRRRLVGVVTMDQLMVDCGDGEVQPGDEVVLLGDQGDATITAWEWAHKTGTIAYEIVCGLGADRLPRRYV